MQDDALSDTSSIRFPVYCYSKRHMAQCEKVLQFIVLR